MSNPVTFASSAVAPQQPRVALGLCLVLFAACTFDSGNLRRPNAGDAGSVPSRLDAGDASGTVPHDARYDRGSAGDGPVADRVGYSDVLVARDDTRAPDPDSAVAPESRDADDARDTRQDSRAADAPRDFRQDQGSEASPSDSRDATQPLEGGVLQADTPQQVDTPADTSRMLDGVIMDTADSNGLTGDAAAAEAGGPDTNSLVDGDVPDSGLVIDPDLVLWYRFDENGGTVAYDSAQKAGVSRNATLMTEGAGSATFSTTRQVGTNALALAPGGGPARDGGGYAVIPALDELAPDAVTIAVWVRLALAGPAQTWERIYDFGDSTTAPRWLNLTARSGASPYGPVFNMSKTGHDTPDQQKLTGMTALTANTWHHIAVVLPAGSPTFTGVMYVNGEIAATNSAMTVHFSDIGPTTKNWIGRSQYPDDPYFNGSIDDFRVYSRALRQEEIQALMAVR